MARSSAGVLKFASHLLRQLVDRTHPAFRPDCEVGNLQRHFTGEKQRRHRAFKVISQRLLGLLAELLRMFPVPPQSASQFARHSVHAVDREVDLNRNRGAEVFEHHVTFDGLSFEERLVDQYGDIFLGAQQGQRLRRRGCKMGFFRCELLNCLDTSLGFRKGRDN